MKILDAGVLIALVHVVRVERVHEQLEGGCPVEADVACDMMAAFAT
jgi:hypothetical protein